MGDLNAAVSLLTRYMPLPALPEWVTGGNGDGW
jgi:hypothetical protein